MSDPSRSSRTRGVVLGAMLIIGLAASWRIFSAPSPTAEDSRPVEDSHLAEGSRPAGATLTELNDSGSAGEVTRTGTRSAPGEADSRSPLQADRPVTQVAEAEESDSAAADPDIDEAVSLEERARHARTLGRLDDAAGYLEAALSLREERLAPDDPRIAETLGKLAGVYAEQGRDEDAVAAYLRAIGINESSGRRSILAAAALSDLALLYRRQGNSQDALPLLESALDIELDVFGPQHPNVASRLAALGLLYRQQGLYEEAEPFLVEALLVRERVYAIDDPETTGAMSSLAHLYREQGRYAEAEDLFQRALSIHENMGEPPRIALDLANLSVVYVSNDQFSDAETVFERALRIEDKDPWSTTAMVAQGVNQLARGAQAAGNTDQAEEIYTWALETSQRVLGDESPNTVFLRDQYIQYLRSLGRNHEAAALEEG